MVAVGRVRRARVPGGADRVGPWLVATVVVVATFRSHLPDWFSGLLDGWVAGFFVAFDVFLISRWRSDVRRTDP
jgi:hypothetical protein